jgi:hypothetical protein
LAVNASPFILLIACFYSHGEAAHVCFSDGDNIGYGASLKSFLRESFQFLEDQPHQAIVLHLEENPMNSVDIRQVERVIDDVCVELANRTAGVFWFDAGQVSAMESNWPGTPKTTHAVVIQVSLDLH